MPEPVNDLPDGAKAAGDPGREGIDLALVSQLMPFDPFDKDIHTDPYPTYRRLAAEHGPVMTTPSGVLSVLGHREAAVVLRNVNFGWGENPPVADQFVETPDGPIRPLMFTDPPDHTRIRALVSTAFTPRVVEKLRGQAEKSAAMLMAQAREKAGGGTVDLMETLIRHLPAEVLGGLLDIPAEYHEPLLSYYRDHGIGLDPGFLTTPAQKEAGDRARYGFYTTGAEIAALRRITPGDDLVSTLVAAEQDGQKLSEGELTGTLMNLLAAGFGATAALIGNSVLGLLRHPDQLQWLRDNPDRIPDAVEELMRHDAPVQMTMRIALDDTELAGRPVPKGGAVMVWIGAANRDTTGSPDAETLDLARTSNRNLGFGHGVHYCVGAPIARMSAQVVLAELLRHPVTLAAPDPARMPRYPGTVLRTLESLPVAFEAP
jgi:cytochrome P450